MVLWSRKASYEPEPYESEAEFEKAIQAVKGELFGSDRIYLEVKRRIGREGKKVNIPDGYLVDLSSPKNPTLYVVENELARHDPLKHIAVQILEFSLSYETDPQRVKRVVREALDVEPGARRKCDEYARKNGFENLDFLLEHMIYKGGFGALVIIDEVSDELQAVLSGRFRFGVEVITLQRFLSKNAGRLYQFEPFLADVSGSPVPSGKVRGAIDLSEVDTIVVPAQEDGFKRVYLGENRWWSVRIHGSMIPRIKYCAVYQVAPISAITYIAPVGEIDQWKSSAKYVLSFSDQPQKVGPIKLVKKGVVKPLYGPRYTSRDLLIKAKNLDDAF